MMLFRLRKIFFFALALIVCCASLEKKHFTFLDEGFAFTAKSQEQAIDAAARGIRVGESFEYLFTYFGIYAARLNLEVKGIVDYNGINCYRIVAVARPRKLFSFFYNVRYEVETLIDAQTRKPIKFHKRKIRGKKIINEVINFQYRDNIATWEYTGHKSEKIPLVENTQDSLSALYYFRLMDIRPQTDYLIHVLYNGRIWPIKVKVGKVTPLKLPRQKNPLDVFIVEPVSGLGKYIIGEEKTTIQFTADAAHIPLVFKIRLKANPLIGRIRCLPNSSGSR
jgi:hypothetical protein